VEVLRGRFSCGKPQKPHSKHTQHIHGTRSRKRALGQACVTTTKRQLHIRNDAFRIGVENLLIFRCESAEIGHCTQTSHWQTKITQTTRESYTRSFG
jgi:hypothetical protein